MNIVKQEEIDIKKQYNVIDPEMKMRTVFDPLVNLSNKLLYISSRSLIELSYKL